MRPQLLRQLCDILQKTILHRITCKDHFNLVHLSRVDSIYGGKHSREGTENEALNAVQMTVKIFLQIL